MGGDTALPNRADGFGELSNQSNRRRGRLRVLFRNELWRFQIGPSLEIGPISLINGAVLLGILLALGLHELTHGLVMQVFGAKPKYGILWKEMMLYATSPG